MFSLFRFDRGSKAQVLLNTGGHTYERYDVLRRGVVGSKTLKFALVFFERPLSHNWESLCLFRRLFCCETFLYNFGFLTLLEWISHNDPQHYTYQTVKPG